MNKKKVMLVFGTRPEAIKMAPIVKVLQSNAEFFDTKVCISAQHREMLDQVLDFFQIEADYDLDLMTDGQTLLELSSKLMTKLERVLKEYKPDLVLVHGDTTTSFIATLTSYYLQIPVAHVEAGLRTNDINSPFPEEGNRQLTSRLASLHFAPTDKNAQNLQHEGISTDKIFIVGNSVIDALKYGSSKIEEYDNQYWDSEYPELAKFLRSGRQNILVTAHRRESFGAGFERICQALKELALKYPDVDIIYPIHPNPNVKKVVELTLSDISNIYLIKPLGYVPFLRLMKSSVLVLTDSGGIQEEAPSLNKPVLVLREVTEREEALLANCVKLVGTDVKIIVEEVSAIIDSNKPYIAPKNPYGEGRTSQDIVEVLKQQLFD